MSQSESRSPHQWLRTLAVKTLLSTHILVPLFFCFFFIFPVENTVHVRLEVVLLFLVSLFCEITLDDARLHEIGLNCRVCRLPCF